MCALLTLVLWNGQAGAQDARGIAQNLYAVGVQHFDQGHFDDALGEFRRSLDLVSSPNTRLMIARTQIALERLVDAAYSYELTVAEARDLSSTQPRYGPTIAAAESELATLGERLGRLRVVVVPRSAAPTIRIDGDDIPAGALGSVLWAEPGSHQVEIRADGYAPVRRDLNIRPREQSELEVALLPLAMQESVARPHRTVGLLLDVLGAAVLGTAAVTLGLAGAQHADLRSRCETRCASELQSDVRRGERLARAGYALSVIGGITLGTGLTLTFIPGKRAPEQAGIAWASHFK